MADSLTPNLKLRVSDDLTADAKYNLNRIDGLASATKVENNGNLRVRSIRDIILTPESQDLGGNGTGGTVSVGESGVEIDTFEIFADLVDFNDSPALIREIRFPELTLNGINYVGFAPPDLIAANVIWTLPNADGTSSQVLVTDGAGNLGWATVATDALPENNVNVGNAGNISTPVDTSVVGDILADSATGFTIKAGVIVNADIDAAAQIALSKLATLGPSLALVSDGAGVISVSGVSAAELAHLIGVTSPLQAQIDSKQASDAELTALAGLITNGIIVKTGAGTAETRTLTAGTGINITNGDGIAGNPVIDSTISQYTDELAQDAIGSALIDTNSIALVYNDGTPSFAANLKLSAEAADPGFFLADVSVETDGLKVQIDESDITTAVAAAGFADDWLNADGTTKVINHALNSQDVMVQVYDSVTFETLYMDSVIRTDANNVTLTATVAPATSWRVLIVRIG